MKKLSIDRIGMRGSIIMLLIGTALLIIGCIMQYQSLKLPENTVECSAVITGFRTEEPSQDNAPKTLVSYQVDNKTYTDIPLGQYEGSWKEGDKLEIYCSSDDHTLIWTKTMQYQGVLFILLSASFLLVGIYKIVQFRRIRGVNEDECDTDDSGEEKFKLSSAIIPLLAGIPSTTAGILFGIFEKKSFLAVIIVVMGTASIMAGITSLIHFIAYKRTEAKKKKQSKA